MKYITKSLIGEALVGDGPEVAHIDLVIKRWSSRNSIYELIRNTKSRPYAIARNTRTKPTNKASNVNNQQGDN